MKSIDIKALTEYVRWVADEVGLKDWTFDVKVGEDKPKNDAIVHDDDDTWVAMATVSPTPGTRRAAITFDPSFRQEKREFQREIVVHELVHCHFADLYEHGRKGVLDLVHQSVYDAWMHGFALSWEHAVDAIACVIAPTLPMIAWPIEPKVAKAETKRSA